MNERKKGGGKKKKSSYKIKRSFTRNKKLRSDSPEKARKSFKKDGETSPPKKMGKGFDKEKRELNRGKRFDRKERYASRDKEGRGEKKDFKEKREGFKGNKYNEERRSEQTFERKQRYSGEKEGRDEKKDFREKREGFKRSRQGEKRNDYKFERKEKSFSKFSGPKRDFREEKHKKTFADEGLIRLNRYIANAGVCSRREADDLIATGCVSVNGKIVTEMGYKVKPTDVVSYGGERLKTEKLVYILLNKPKDYITTSDDERGRRTVMELIQDACKERVYPVGRLDRNTTGLLLFTNDGELAKKLTHPQHNVQKLYHVELDKNLKHDDLLKIQNGIELEDGFIKPDEVAYAGESKREVGIMVHSGKNRIVRRIFESLGYDVLRLDRTLFAGLSKKDLPRGRWRMLTPKEISFLKMI